ncbi:MAG: response regulator [Gammaproteobacteria bacterium]|nr:response regulator [Gammaproteobacteria bacterium]
MKVMLIDDHALFRSGLEHLLVRRGIEVVATTSDGEQALTLIQETHPHVILLDIRMPKLGGIETLRRLRAGGVTVPIVMLTTSSDEADLVSSLHHGAQGYLLKDMEPDGLVAALARIETGEMIVAPEFAPVLARFIQSGPEAMKASHAFSELTPREMEILGHLGDGQSNKVIARSLGISEGTVKLHVKAILRKLKLSSRVQAAVRSVEEGFGRKS